MTPDPNTEEPMMEAGTELLPCPFCGGEARYIADHTLEKNDTIVCPKCICEISAFHHGDEFVSAWNTRVKPTPVSDTDAVEVTPELIEHVAKAMFENCQRNRFIDNPDRQQKWPPSRELEYEWVQHARAAIQSLSTKPERRAVAGGETMMRGKFTIDQADVTAIELALGEFGYLTQGEAMVLIDPRFALELSDRLAAWAVSQKVSGDHFPT